MLSLTVLLLSVSLPSLQMAPPSSPTGAGPSVIVRLFSVAFELVGISNTRLALLPLMVITSPPLIVCAAILNLTKWVGRGGITGVYFGLADGVPSWLSRPG